MTTNPESAGVEPVAWLYCNEDGLAPVKEVVSFVRWTANNRMGWDETALGPIHPPAAREDGEAICEACDKPCHEDRLHVDGNGFMACAAAFTEDGSGDCPNEVCAPSDSAPIFDGVNLETVIATSLASGNDVQPYEVAMAVRAALAAMPTPAAIRAEATAEIVAALEALENDGGPGLSGYVHNGQLLARLSDHLAGGGE